MTARRTFHVLACCALLVQTACVSIDLPGGSPAPLKETVVYGDSGPKVVMLQIDGVLSDDADSNWLGVRRESPVARLREELDHARADSTVRGLLLRIDTPGGTVTASDLIYQEILRFKRERNVPVVAQLMGMATSGGYYVAMSADAVVAHPTTVTGSIGVIFVGINLTGLMEKFGVENQTLTSGAFKDAGSPMRPMRAEERAQLQSVVDDMYQRFLGVVRTGRPRLSPEEVARLADGRIYSADQALENGLVDRLGSIEDAVAEVRTKAGLDAVRVVTYHRPREYRKNLYTASAPIEAPALSASHWPRLPQPAFLYMWAPAGFLE